MYLIILPSSHPLIKIASKSTVMFKHGVRDFDVKQDKSQKVIFGIGSNTSHAIGYSIVVELRTLKQVLHNVKQLCSHQRNGFETTNLKVLFKTVMTFSLTGVEEKLFMLA